jgi:hypothetical protein
MLLSLPSIWRLRRGVPVLSAMSACSSLFSVFYSDFLLVIFNRLPFCFSSYCLLHSFRERFAIFHTSSRSLVLFSQEQSLRSVRSYGRVSLVEPERGVRDETEVVSAAPKSKRREDIKMLTVSGASMSYASATLSGSPLLFPFSAQLL